MRGPQIAHGSPGPIFALDSLYDHQCLSHGLHTYKDTHAYTFICTQITMHIYIHTYTHAHTKERIDIPIFLFASLCRPLATFRSLLSVIPLLYFPSSGTRLVLFPLRSTVSFFPLFANPHRSFPLHSPVSLFLSWLFPHPFPRSRSSI